MKQIESHWGVTNEDTCQHAFATYVAAIYCTIIPLVHNDNIRSVSLELNLLDSNVIRIQLSC